MKFIRQYLLIYKKNLLYWVLAFLCAQIFLFNFGGIWNQNQVFAEGNTSTQSESFNERAAEAKNLVWSAEKIMYVLLYPFLFLAGKLVDNSMVYWEVFWFDAILWKLRNIVRNIANFGLWFIFVYNVAKILISKKNDGIKKLLISSLIAWVWIQASWFIMAALIDISTIATYGIWGLPISVLWLDSDDKDGSTSWDWWDKNDWKYDPYVLWTSIYVDADDSDTIRVYLVNGSWESGLYISPCETFVYTEKSDWKEGTDTNSGKNEEELIIAPSLIYYVDNWKVYPTEPGMCNHYWMVYYMKSTVEQKTCSWIENCKQEQMNYMKALNEQIIAYQQQNTESIASFIKGWNLLQIWDAHISWWVVWDLFMGISYGEDKLWLDVDNKWTWGERSLPTLSSLLKTTENWWSFLWVFTVLYTSLLNAGADMKIDVSWDGVWSGLLNVFLSFAHVCGIWIPLIVMVLVLFIRIFLLRLAIALSPVIVLLKAFGFDEKVFKEWFLKHLQILNLISVIFAPVMVCFAVSLSTVLVRKISELNTTHIASAPTEILWWVITLNIWGFWVGLWKLLVSVICIALTWVLMRWAIESTSIWWEKWVGSLKKMATDSLWSIPVVPVIGKDKDGNLQTKFVGSRAAFGEGGEWWVISWIWNRLKEESRSKDTEAINSLFNKSDEENESSEKRYEAYSSSVLKWTEVPTNWTDHVVKIGENNDLNYKFSDLSSEYQIGLIDQINKLTDTTARKKFGDSQRIVDVPEKWTYQFDDATSTYKKQTS